MAYLDIYALATSGDFSAPITVAVAKAAYDVLNESPATPNHAERVVWAMDAMVHPETVAERMLWTVAQNPTIQATGLPVVDNDIQFAVNSLIDTFALA